MLVIGCRIAAAALAYFLVAQLGMMADVGGGPVSSVWPATGVAMATLWLGGIRFWVAIALGELLSSLVGGWTVGAAALSATGNTADAVIGVLLLRRFGFGGRFATMADVPRFALSPVLACVTSSTLGVYGLVATGQASPGEFGVLWLTWWGSAVAGTLIVFPFLVTALKREAWALPRTAVAELAVFIAASTAAFALLLSSAASDVHGQEHVFFILAIAVLVWPAIRYTLPWATLTVLALVAAVTAATGAGVGPFAMDGLRHPLLLLQAFIGVVSLVTLVVYAALHERDQAMEAMRRGKEAAEDAARAKSAFLAAMSHELRTPLNAIIGFAQVLSRDDLSPIRSAPHKVAEYGTHIQQAGDSLLSLINDLLDLSKIDAGKLEVAEEDVPLDEVIGECLTLIRHHPNGDSVTLSYEAGVEHAFLRTDRRRFQQILLNLLSNAVKYTPSGGSVTLRTERAGGRFRVVVSDTGIGMTAAQLATALIPFAQIDNPLTRKNRGTGLGLPLTDQLARQLGGVLHLASQPHRGTTAVVDFPDDKLHAPEPAGSADRAPAPAKAAALLPSGAR